MTPAELALLHARAFPDSRAWSEAEFTALLAATDTILAANGHAFALGRVIGAEAEILTLASDPAHRRQGHARAALDAFEQAARARGAGAILLEVAENNTAARALYAAAGYNQAGWRPGYYRTLSGQRVNGLLLRKPFGPLLA